MATSAAAMSQNQAPDSIDLRAVKARQQGAWSSGDYAVVGTTLQIVGEELSEALDLRSGQTVLDVAAGNGNASLAAASRWCDVVATDYVPALLERARERAAAERLAIEFREADAEALPFPNASFDVVVSTFGVMFTPDQDRAAAELIRVCRPEHRGVRGGDERHGRQRGDDVTQADGEPVRVQRLRHPDDRSLDVLRGPELRPAVHDGQHGDRGERDAGVRDEDAERRAGHGPPRAQQARAPNEAPAACLRLAPRSAAQGSGWSAPVLLPGITVPVLKDHGGV